jgi:hypothetical protein
MNCVTRRMRLAPARSPCNGIARNAAAATTCATATATSSLQSASVSPRHVQPEGRGGRLRLRQRTIAPVTGSCAAGFGLWLTLVIPSSFVVHKYVGWKGLVAYAIVVALIVTLGPRLSARLANRHLLWLACLTFLLVVFAFLLIYPIANTGMPGAGSDDDDALNLGAMALLTGRSPYSQTTYLGNVLHHLPGAFVLATPFVLLGTSALQNLFWLPLFFLAVRKDANSRIALQLAWAVLALSPCVMYEIVTGTGYISNTIYVLLGLWWLVRTEHRDVAALAWGVALASRANVLVLVPLAFGYLWQRSGLRIALRAMAIACASAACLGLPFYLHDPLNFGPLEGASRLLVFNQLLPHLGIALIVLMAALALALSFTRMNAAALFRNCALVQAFPLVAGLVLATLRDRQLNLWYARYGSFAMWFALMALASTSEVSARARSSIPPALRRRRTRSASYRRA